MRGSFKGEKNKEKKTQGVNRKNNRRVSKPKSSKKSKKIFFRKWPVCAIWIGCILCILVFIFVFYFTFIDSYSFNWRGSYNEAKYPTKYDVHGIDISHYQKRIDWEKLRNAQLDTFPIQFVFIKATEGCNFVDKRFKYNFRKAKENDLIRGAYHFFSPTTSAQQQAQLYIKHVKLIPGDLPPVLDVEKKGRLTKAELRKEVKIWLDVVEKHYNIKPIIYTGSNFKRRYLNTSEFKDYLFWIAHYHIDDLRYKGKWAFWQHTDCGRANGICGDVDCNVFNGTYDELKSLTIPFRSQSR